MAIPAQVTPNRRGTRSRQAVLDAAEGLMAEQGYVAASVAAIVEASGIPLSSVYHYFGSKDGILLAVMERGAERFFGELPDVDQRIGDANQHLNGVAAAMAENLNRHPNFLRLLVGFAVQPPSAGDGEVRLVVNRIRQRALGLIAVQLGLAFDESPFAPSIRSLAQFTLATIDGAFVAQQSDPAVKIEMVLQPLAASAVALWEQLRPEG